MDTWLFWMIGAFVLLGLEIASGTLFLLMLSGGFAAASLVAGLGFGSVVQNSVAGLVSVVLLFLLKKKWIKKRRHSLSFSHDPELNLDVGQKLFVEQWLLPTKTRAVYRGSEWDVELLEGEEGHPGEYLIIGLKSNCLLVKKI